MVNEKCSAQELCNDLVGLSSVEGVCKCGNNSYWKDNKCGKLNFFAKNQTSNNF